MHNFFIKKYFSILYNTNALQSIGNRKENKISDFISHCFSFIRSCCLNIFYIFTTGSTLLFNKKSIKNSHIPIWHRNDYAGKRLELVYMVS